MRRVIFLGLLITVACAVLLYCGDDDEGPTVFLPPRRVFEDGRELFFAKENRDVVWLSWAPDGRRFAYVDNVDGRDFRINIYDTLTHGDRVLLEGYGSKVLWSPTGEYILFHEPDYSYSVIKPDGTGRKRVIKGSFETNDYDADWAPDGRRLVWTAKCMPGPDWSRNIYTKSIDGTKITRLSRDADAHEEYPLWSPQGDWIAFFKTDRLFEWRPEWRTPITLVDVAGTDYKVLWRGNRSDEGVCRWLSDWSPDGRYILFNAGSETSAGVYYDFWCFDVEKRTFKQVTSAPSSWFWDYDGCFGPDGKIYFSVFDPHDVCYGIWRVDPKL